MPPVDQGLPELLIDLEQHGLARFDAGGVDDRFRPHAEDQLGQRPRPLGQRGLRRDGRRGNSRRHGARRDRRQGRAATRNEYSTDDVAATIYAKLGLPLDLIVNAPDGRPVRLIEGKPIREWV